MAASMAVSADVLMGQSKSKSSDLISYRLILTFVVMVMVSAVYLHCMYVRAIGKRACMVQDLYNQHNAHWW